MDSQEKMEVGSKFPYHLAKSRQIFFEKNPTGRQAVAWLQQIGHDVFQYVTLILLAHRYKLSQTALLPHYDTQSWQQLLEELLAADDGKDPIPQAIAAVYDHLQNTAVEIANAQVSLGEAIVGQNNQDNYAEDLCAQILYELYNALRPLTSFSLCQVIAHRDGTSQLLPLVGDDPNNWQTIDVEGTIAAPGKLVLQSENCLALSPFIVLNPNRDFDIIMWDGEIKQTEQAIYHSATSHIVFWRQIPGYKKALTSTIKISDYSTLRQYLQIENQQYLAQSCYKRRYQPLAFFPQDDIAAEISNFVYNKLYGLCLLTGYRGSGKTNTICNIIKNLQKNHLPLVVTADYVSNLDELPRVKKWQHSWKQLLELCDSNDQRCILLVSDVETHPDAQALLSNVEKFLAKYSPSPLRIILIVDSDIWVALPLREQLPSQFLYRSHTSANGSFLTMPCFSEWQVEKMYRQYQIMPGNAKFQDFADLAPQLKKTLQTPMWLGLMSAGCENWSFPTDIPCDEILFNYMQHTLFEHPSVNAALNTLLPKFLRQQECSVTELAAGEELQLCQQHGILYQRVSPKSGPVVAFSSPLLRDVVIAFQHSSLEKIIQLFADNTLLNYHARCWALVFYLLENPQQLTLDSKIVEQAEIVAQALLMCDEIESAKLANVNSWETRLEKLGSFLLKQKGQGIEALLILLDKLVQRASNVTFERIAELMWENYDFLERQQLRRLFAITTNYYCDSDGDRAVELGEKWWALMVEGKECDDKREIAHCLANVYRKCGQVDKALVMADIALQISQSQEQQLAIYQDLQCLAACYCQQKDFSKAQEHYEEMQSLAQDQLQDIALILNVLYKLSEVYRNNGELMAAVSCYDDIIDIAENISGNLLDVIQSLWEKGSLYRSSGQMDDAIEFYQKALACAQALGAISQVAMLWSEIASLYADQGEEQQALQSYEQALRLSEQMAHLPLSAKIYHDLANFYDDQCESEQAIESLRKSINLYQQLGNQEKVAETLAALGMVYDAENQYANALDCYQQAGAILQQSQNLLGFATNLKNMAVLYHGQKNFAKALEHFQGAKDIFHSLGEENELHIVKEWISKINA